MAMFIAVLLTVTGIALVMIVAAKENATIPTVVAALTTSICLITIAAVLIKVLLAIVIVGSALFAVGAISLYEDLKNKDGLWDLAILPLSLGITFLGMATYYYCM